MLRRVIALLVAFAVIAERAAERSPWVRCFVLWILRRAEKAAVEVVFEETGTPPQALDRTPAVGNDPESALRLAARFRALAAALRALLPVGFPLHQRRARRGFAFGQGAPGAFRFLGGWTREPFDTS